MKWSRPTWPITLDVVGYGIAVLASLIAAGLSASSFGPESKLV
jgi:hypothetical protein